MVGLFGGDVTVPTPYLPLRAMTLRGSYVGSQTDMAELLDLVKRTGMPPVPISTRPLEEVNATLNDLRAGKIVGRVVLTPAASRFRHARRTNTKETMDATALRAMQAPIKERYKGDPGAAMITLKAKGTLDDSNIACKVETGRALAVAGLHPATGGSGLELCSGDMLLEALVACAGVTLKAVSTALDIPLKSAQRVGGRRSRFPRHARRRQGRAGRLRADPPHLRRRHRRAAGQARPAAQAHRALLRGVSDHQERPAGRGQLKRA